MIDMILADKWWNDVEADAEVALVKTNVTVEVPCDGTIAEILLPEQETLARGMLLARIRSR